MLEFPLHSRYPTLIIFPFKISTLRHTPQSGKCPPPRRLDNTSIQYYYVSGRGCFVLPPSVEGSSHSHQEGQCLCLASSGASVTPAGLFSVRRGHTPLRHSSPELADFWKWDGLLSSRCVFCLLQVSSSSFKVCLLVYSYMTVGIIPEGEVFLLQGGSFNGQYYDGAYVRVVLCFEVEEADVAAIVSDLFFFSLICTLTRDIIKASGRESQLKT